MQEPANSKVCPVGYDMRTYENDSEVLHLEVFRGEELIDLFSGHVSLALRVSEDLFEGRHEDHHPFPWK